MDELVYSDGVLVVLEVAAVYLAAFLVGTYREHRWLREEA